MRQAFCLLTSFTALLLIVPLADARAFNNDFETGDLTDWEKTGTAFDFQPTWGDNPTARNRGQPSQHQGDWWLGLAEKYQGPDKGRKLGQKPGDLADGVDAPQGTLTSMKFKIIGETMNFLIGGGNRSWGVNPEPCGVNLVIDGEVERSATGNNNESMTRKEWDVSDLKGQLAQLVVYDNSSGGWDIRTLTMCIKPTQSVKIYRGIRLLQLKRAAS